MNAFGARVIGRIARVGVVGALLAVVLTGCIRADERITFDAQGAGTYEMTFGMDTAMMREMAAAMGDSGGQGSSSGPNMSMSDAERAELVAKFGPGTEVDSASVTEDGTTWDGARIRIPFNSVERFNALGPELAASGSGGSSGSPAATLQVTVQDDTFTATGRLESIMPSSAQGPEAAMMAHFFGKAIHIVRVTVPGQVTATNADYREGRTYIWENEGDDPAREMRISWRPAGNPALSVEP
ncbi:MAG: hypothetical protein AVDCRST_MAG77-3144 [uncultured Chloroflexi bacterium]|uniref:Lipoprotein n=1 Tax=uncultured Chloroflexota bacterium TaxID=166587 RepID=A0A6J4J6N8_9CHLR|nr:MAG: hypothetical protein AVDCRST_MAG77-3144 [uncultured Chloroflexota bacterium]